MHHRPAFPRRVLRRVVAGSTTIMGRSGMVISTA
jgi:hypothetical protein